ncbi:ABC protein [Mycena venus]|uniref:ABC protein n=1 Tax=Mycena venus TaxID=2733690 RepID=A0A8H6XQF2_9AGAR|nr:ABC protein [Mycena venus]
MNPVARCSECGFLFAGTSNDIDSDSISESFAVRVDTTHEYDRLLNSNDTPDEDRDLKLVDSVVSQTEACLGRLDDHITRLRTRLKQLEDQQRLLSNYLARNKSILSPLRRMPPEILLEVFSWTLSPILAVRRGGSFNVNEPPWILGHVSSRWRAVALAAPSLWSMVALNYTAPVDDRSRTNSRSMLETQLARARTLKVHFYGSEIYETQPQTEMFEFLAAHSTRWEELSISLTSDLVPLLASLRGRIPLLRRLWLQWDSSRSLKNVESIECFDAAPSLTDVGVYNEYAFIPMRFPVRQLTRYQLDGSWQTHKRFLEHARHLVEVRIDVCFSITPWNDSDEIIEVLSLRRLYVKDPKVLNHLRVPALEEIALCCTHADWESGDNSYLMNLQSLVARSSCLLRRLCVKGLIPAEATVGILHGLPSILEFVIITNGYLSSTEAETLMESLTDVSEDTTVAPQLAYLFVGCENGSSIDYEMYLKMISSRWEADHCALHSAALLTDSDPGPDDETLLALQKLRYKGVDLLLLDGAEASEMIGGWTYTSLWN